MRSTIDYLTEEEIKALTQAAASLAREREFLKREKQPGKRTRAQSGSNGQKKG
jgi:hypothetical protein